MNGRPNDVRTPSRRILADASVSSCNYLKLHKKMRGRRNVLLFQV